MACYYTDIVTMLLPAVWCKLNLSESDICDRSVLDRNCIRRPADGWSLAPTTCTLHHPGLTGQMRAWVSPAVTIAPGHPM